MPPLVVRMRVEVEVAVTPADEETESKEDYEGGDGGLRALLEPLGQITAGEEDRNTEHDEGDAMTEPPPSAEPCRRPRRPLVS